MKNTKFLTINILIINCLFQINKKISAEEIKIKSPLLNKFNKIEYDKRLINSTQGNFKPYILKNNISNIDFNQNPNTKLQHKSSINLFKAPLPEKKITKNINLLNNLSITEKDLSQKNFKSNFKDLSSSFLSPYGGHVPRAPDESLKACKTQECYE